MCVCLWWPVRIRTWVVMFFSCLLSLYRFDEDDAAAVRSNYCKIRNRKLFKIIIIYLTHTVYDNKRGCIGDCSLWVELYSIAIATKLKSMCLKLSNVSNDYFMFYFIHLLTTSTIWCETVLKIRQICKEEADRNNYR